jgi:hypothetical protein
MEKRNLELIIALIKSVHERKENETVVSMN